MIGGFFICSFSVLVEPVGIDAWCTRFLFDFIIPLICTLTPTPGAATTAHPTTHTGGPPRARYYCLWKNMSYR
jgi:hypothetical protein